MRASFHHLSPPPALLVSFIALVTAAYAHGDHEDMAMAPATLGEMASSMVNATATAVADSSYFQQHEHSGLIIGHIALMTTTWVFVLPIGVMFSISHSRYNFPAQFIFFLMNGLGVLLSTIYNSQTPNLYSHNAHHTIGWILTWLVGAQTCMALTTLYNGTGKDSNNSIETAAFIPISTQVMAEHQRAHRPKVSHDYRWSHDSGQGTERNTESLRSPSSSTAGGEEEEALQFPPRQDYYYDSDDIEKNASMAGTKIETYLRRLSSAVGSSRLFKSLVLINDISIRLILILGFVGLVTGIVTYAGIFRGDRVFSGMAHFIKGAIFFWYGILTLGRWAGCFSDRGWAWNISPAKSQKFSAEFTESFLIFFYGSTNVFLEHLASWGDAWSAQDLEHISITIMFIGGGLCGMLIESSRVRNLLNATVLYTSLQHTPASYNDDNTYVNAWHAPKSYKFSMNPIPALIILLLGKMMSSHHQESMIATMIHGQWGALLMGAAFARGATYVIFYLSPPASFLPSRPPTELITAFCLMAGGIIFMASSTDTVAAMEYNSLDAMFVFTVAMGIITFLMTWIILVIAVKGWAVKKEAKESPARILA